MSSKLLSIAMQAAKLAGNEVMSYYRDGSFEAHTKLDESPVTSADYAANDVLVDYLKTHAPDIPIISEESEFLPLAQRKDWPRYWLLDPIDGTGEFIAGSGDFAVNVALVEQGWPAIGVIHAPSHELTYYAANGEGAFKEDSGKSVAIQVARYQQGRAIKVAVSRRQKIDLMGQYLNHEVSFDHIPLGSCSLKNCLIAEGGADCYLRIGPTGEWDTGASHCIVELAGGSIVDSQFNSLSYNKRESLLNPDFITLGNGAIPWQDIIKPHQTKRSY